jgi:hypothetical protein
MPLSEEATALFERLDREALEKGQGDDNCRICGKLTGKGQFMGSGPSRIWMHYLCMQVEGLKLMESGAWDNVRVAINWPDGPAEITTGKQMRERLRDAS